MDNIKAEHDLFDLSISEYCKESEQDGFLFAPDKNGCSLDKSNGYCSGFMNGFEKGYKYQQLRIIELEEALSDVLDTRKTHDIYDKYDQVIEIAEQALKQK